MKCGSLEGILPIHSAFPPLLGAFIIIMKQKELEIIEILNNYLIDPIRPEVDTYSITDARNKNYIVELKHRNKFYSDMIIEFDKYKRLMDSSIYYNLIPLYVCSVENGDVYVFNMNYVDAHHIIEWEDQMHNKTTEFINNNKIKKKVGFIPVSLSKKICVEDIIKK